jgi:hypothetical protein
LIGALIGLNHPFRLILQSLEQTTYTLPFYLHNFFVFLPFISQCICGKPLFPYVCWLQLPCPLWLLQPGALLMPPWQFNLRALGSTADSRNSKNPLELLGHFYNEYWS